MNDSDIIALENRIIELEKYASDLKQNTEDLARMFGSTNMRYGVYSAIVISTFDVWKQNRIQYYTPFLDEATISTDSLPWAAPISSLGGFDDCGLSWVPPAGSKVFIVFENGLNGSAFYLGTTWTRFRGPTGANDFGIPVPEFAYCYDGKNVRDGYFCGPDNGSQVLPPWNTESYNAFDTDSLENVDKDPTAPLRQTLPNIYGFKTPEKHMIKMVDGDFECNRKWKRMEIMSGNGNWMIFKDDHLHYCGQWAHPDCQPNKKRIADTSCIKYNNKVVPNPKPYSATDITRFNNNTINNGGQVQQSSFNYTGLDKLIPGVSSNEDTTCNTKKRNIIGGESENQTDIGTQKGTNPFFKNKNECRPYKGPQTPQNNTADLPQSGIQIMSISGHTLVMDDSVDQPRGNMSWKRSLENFDFGCNDRFMGRSYWKSTTGHLIQLNDIERKNGKQVRGDENGIKIKSALGNEIFLCDAVEGKKYDDKASKDQGILIRSTSNNFIKISDEGNKRKVLPRRDGTQPESKATNASITIQTGYGLAIKMSDAQSQSKTQFQSISMFAPQKNSKQGPHLFQLQELPERGYIRLRAGGNILIESTDSMILATEKSIVNYAKEKRVDFVEQDYYIRSNKVIAMQATDKIYLLAGNDYEIKRQNQFFANVNISSKNNINTVVNETVKKNEIKKGPGLAPVVVYQNGCLRISNRVYASCGPGAKGISLGSLVLPKALAVSGNTNVYAGKLGVLQGNVTGTAKLPPGCN